MSFVLLGVIAIVALLALIAIFMSIKTWHWAQMLLVLGVFLLGLTAMFLSAEVLRIHRSLRAGLPKIEEELANLEQQNDALQHGTDDMALASRLFEESPFDESDEEMPGISELNHELQLSARRRGRSWTEVMPVGNLGGGIAVRIPEDQPALNQNAIIYVFEAGQPNGSNPPQGAQYLGEFVVAEVIEGGAGLIPVRALTPREGQRLAASRGPWTLYETMPSDRHDIFAELPPNQLRALLPSTTVEEYLRHGGPITPDDDEYVIAGYDEKGRRVGADEVQNVTDKRYDRQLRAYSYLFQEIARRRTLILADLQATSEDIRSLVAAHKHAEELTAYREREITALKKDLTAMKRDRAAIASHLEKLNVQLENARTLLQRALDANAKLAEQLTQRQLGLLQAFSGGAATNPAFTEF